MGNDLFYLVFIPGVFEESAPDDFEYFIVRYRFGVRADAA